MQNTIVKPILNVFCNLVMNLELLRDIRNFDPEDI